MFPYIVIQTRRWKLDARLDDPRKVIGQELLRRGIESRVVSMVDERPLEALVYAYPVKNSRSQLAAVREPVAVRLTRRLGPFLVSTAEMEAFAELLECVALNSRTVLSNWYPIGSGRCTSIHGSGAVRYHPIPRHVG